MMRVPARILVASIVIGATLLTGCVRRTISITSDPPGALVYLNHLEVGRTPVEVDFKFYGEYDIRLIKDGYEPLITRGDADAPWWDNPPVDLAAEMIPGETTSRTAWHFTLEPRNDDPDALLERARDLRGHPPAPPSEASDAPVDGES